MRHDQTKDCGHPHEDADVSRATAELRQMVEQCILHNEEHARSCRLWAGRARDAGFTEPGLGLEQFASDIAEQNNRLIKIGEIIAASTLVRDTERVVPIISIVGASNSGKTTFLENLIPELASRGYRVGAVKHDVHGFEMDREGKDTWRLQRAGAEAVAISSPGRFASIRSTRGELCLEEIAARFFWTEDIVITEGFKRAGFPKIEVFRSAIAQRPVCGPDDNLIACVTDDAVDAGVPLFSTSDVRGVAEFIEYRYLPGGKKVSL